MKPAVWGVAVPVLLLASFLLGQANISLPETPISVVRRGSGPSDEAVLRPGEMAVAAITFLKTLKSDPPSPPPPPPPPPQPPPPPPPDVALVFKQALRGVQTHPSTGEARVLVSMGGNEVRALAQGELFADGWTIQTVTRDAITLAKGKETRNVRVFG